MKNKLSETFKSMESVSFGVIGNVFQMENFFFLLLFLLRELSENAILSQFVFESCVTHSPGV